MKLAQTLVAVVAISVTLIEAESTADAQAIAWVKSASHKACYDPGNKRRFHGTGKMLDWCKNQCVSEGDCAAIYGALGHGDGSCWTYPGSCSETNHAEAYNVWQKGLVLNTDGYYFKFVVDVRFNNWSGEHYPCILTSSNGAFQFHGMGPAYGDNMGKLAMLTTAHVGAHGRGGGDVHTSAKLTQGVWYRVTVEKTADQLCIQLNSGAPSCAMRTVTAEQFQMKSVGVLSWAGGSNIEGKNFFQQEALSCADTDSTVSYAGYTYRTLTGFSRTSSAVSCENIYTTVPSGWEIAPYHRVTTVLSSSNVLNNVVRPYPWQARVMHMAGTSTVYHTSAYNKDHTGSNMVWSGNQVKSGLCSAAILIRRSCQAAAAPTTAAPTTAAPTTAAPTTTAPTTAAPTTAAPTTAAPTTTLVPTQANCVGEWQVCTSSKCCNGGHLTCYDSGVEDFAKCWKTGECPSGAGWTCNVPEANNADSIMAAFRQALTENKAVTMLTGLIQYVINASTPQGFEQCMNGSWRFFPSVWKSCTFPMAACSVLIVVSGLLISKIRKKAATGPVAAAVCIVCFIAPVQATFVHGPSGHTVCCMACAQVIQRTRGECPICRQHLDAVIRNFLA